MADASTIPAAMPALVSAAQLRVQVCHALPDEASLETLTVAAGTTIARALAASALASRLPGLLPAIERGETRVGIFGKVKTPDTVLRDGDRIEVYRPLQADPKETRRRRAKHKEQATGR